MLRSKFIGQNHLCLQLSPTFLACSHTGFIPNSATEISGSLAQCEHKNMTHITFFSTVLYNPMVGHRHRQRRMLSQGTMGDPKKPLVPIMAHSHPPVKETFYHLVILQGWEERLQVQISKLRPGDFQV